MDDTHISNFFTRLKKQLFQKEEIYKIIVSSIENNTGCLVDVRNIKIKNAVAYINVGAIAKNEILIKKKIILEEIKKQVFDYNIIDLK